VSESLPFVSIIVPVYNAEGAIGPCIESLLNQDYPKGQYELIVVDDSSTDRTAEVIRRYPVKYVPGRIPPGTFRARNAGVQCARGALLAHCDSDQLAHPSWLRRLVAGLQAGCGGVAGPILAYQGRHDSVVAHYAALDSEINPPLPAGPQERATVVGTGNVLYRKEVHEQLGGFNDDGVEYSADRDFAVRMIKVLGLKIAYAPEAIMYHRPRSTAGKLLRHEMRFGYGSSYLRKSNKDINVESTFGATARMLKNSVQVALAILLTALLFWRHERPFHRIQLIAFGFLMKTAHLLGRYGYAIGWVPPRHW
jgi:glycosyltransferase involved in cell wall biosynthesis